MKSKYRLKDVTKPEDAEKRFMLEVTFTPSCRPARETLPIQIFFPLIGHADEWIAVANSIYKRLGQTKTRTKSKRNITDHDLQAAGLLFDLWNHYRTANPNCTQAQVASEIGISQSMFNMLKNGKVTWSTDHVIKIAAFFGVPVRRFSIMNKITDQQLHALKE